MRRLMFVVLSSWSVAHAADAPTASPQFVEIAPNVSAWQGLATTVVLFRNEAGSVLVDSELPKSAGALRTALAAIGAETPRFVVNTHWHLDHVGGNEALNARGSVVVAHANARRRMSEDTYLKHHDKVMPALPPAALPSVVLHDSGALHIGTTTVQLIHVRAAHTDGDLLVHFPAQNVLHLGDCFFNGLYPIIDTGTGGTADGLIAALDRGLELSNAQTRIIAGHGPIASRADLQAARDMLAQLRDRIAALKRKGLSRDAVLAAEPSKSFDAQWGKSWVKPTQIVGSIYDSLP
jgi:cyclase